jgi:predicted ATPase
LVQTIDKNLNSLKPVDIKPIYLFRGSGAGKSHLIKTIYHTAVKTFRPPPFNPELPTVLLLAPTGVAIPKETGDYLHEMSDQMKTLYRVSLKDLKLIIIDEIYGWKCSTIYIFIWKCNTSISTNVIN